MNFDLVPRRYRVTDEQIDDGDFQAIVTPLWWEVSIYDGEMCIRDRGRIFQPANEKLPIETDVLGMCAYGPDEDFFTSKGALEELLNVLVVDRCV